MRPAKFISLPLAALVLAVGCNRAEPARDQARPAAPRTDTAAEELQRKRADDGARLDKRVADLERRWSEMESSLPKKSAAPTPGLRGEVAEDIKNAREAVANLKTTTPENWWERHERAMERTASDIEEDVRRLAKGAAHPATAQPAEPPDSAAPFTSRRDRFVTRLAARVDTMEDQLKDVRVRDAQKTELQDTRARVDKLKDDVSRLRHASADDWWDISVKRVSEYIDRVEASVKRLDDDKVKR